MKTFIEFSEGITPEVRDAKKVFTALQGMYPKIPKFPLVFKNLQTSKNLLNEGVDIYKHQN